MDLLSPTDGINAIRDAVDRWNAPSRIVQRTSDIFARDKRIDDAINDGSSSVSSQSGTPAPRDEDDVSSRPLHIQLLQQHARSLHYAPSPHDATSLSTRSSNTKESFQRLVNKTRMALRRDELESICKQADKYQDDYYTERIVVGQAKTVNILKEIRINVLLTHCSNVEAAKLIHSCSLTEIDALPKEKQPLYAPIHNMHPTGAVTPVWGIAQKSCPLFSDIASRHRFASLVAVATAFSIAHSETWYHRRLSTQTILIKRDLLSNTHLVSAIPACAVVVNFRCPITTGCFDGCAICRKTWSDTITNNPNSIYALTALPNDTVSFTVAVDKPFADGRYTDTMSIAALTLWLYSGAQLHSNFNPLSVTEDADAMARVPWCLRWIIEDRHRLSLSSCLTFLQALQDGRVQPHCTAAPLVSIPTVVSQVRSEDGVTASVLHELLYYACGRSALIGARTDDAQASLHLGILYKAHAESLPVGSAASTHALKTAWLCFDGAIQFGDSSAYFHLAQLHAQLLDNPRHNVTGVSYACMMYYVMVAASAGDEKAIDALVMAANHGVNVASDIFKQDNHPIVDCGDDELLNDGVAKASQDCGSGCPNRYRKHDSHCDDEFLKAVVDIGKLWRRGQRGFPKCPLQAEDWLLFAHDRGRPDATLELGLLTVQTAQSAKDMQRGKELVNKASNMLGNPAAHTARYWLGLWHHQGLHFATGEAVCTIVKENNDLAAQYFQYAADQGCFDAMASLSMFYRKGIGPMCMDLAAAREWCTRARKGKSMAGFCGYAILLENEAKEAYRRVVMEGEGVTKERGRGKRLGKSGGRLVSLLSNSSDGSSSGNGNGNGQNDMDIVDRRLEVALRVLREVAIRLASIHPEHLLNPIPPWLGAGLIQRNLTAWTKCSTSVRNGTESAMAFQKRMKLEALKLAKMAANMRHDSGWEGSRADYLRQDLFICAEANRLSQALMNEMTASLKEHKQAWNN